MPKKKKTDEIVESEPVADTEAADTAAETEVTEAEEIATDTENEVVVDEIEIAADSIADAEAGIDTYAEVATDVDETELTPEPSHDDEALYTPESTADSAAEEPEISYKLTNDPPDIAELTAEVSESADGTDTAEISEPFEQPVPEVADEPEPTKPTAPQPQPISRKPATPRKKTIFDLKLNELDRGLSDEQRDEWNAIYASYRSKSIMPGTVIGAEQITLEMKNRETGVREKRVMDTLIVIGYRVKIIIPATELWMPGEERPSEIVRAMTGSNIEFVIMDVDREGECAIASRRLAIAERRNHFARTTHSVGDKLTCRMLMVGAKRCTVECNGFDIHLTQEELSYTSIADLREKYRVGQELKCVLKSFDAKAGALAISVKEAAPNPFDGADVRHPVQSRRQATISGKYAGGVFCTLPDDTVCLCLYSAQHSDMNFRVGDGVIIVVTKYDYGRKLMYGKILSKW